MASSSGGGLSRKQSLSSTGKRSLGKLSSASHRQTPPPTTLTPDNSDAPFEPCAATASFLLYAQRNRVLVVHQDTLAIERRFDLHREDVVWIAVDNVSERGQGRLAVSYDAGNTAIVWDILTGGEIARFSAYESIRAASFIRNGNIAFGNDHGNIILFEPSTSEHVSARTIYDAITAIAPSADCRTFAIGYSNGSILIATLQPSFTIIHTLTTTRAPSRITGLSWHGSSSKQKTDMLATQTVDGDLRVWSIPKAPLHEPPVIIRVLQRAESQMPSLCWFAWSKNGRIVQFADGETRAWDVRTKKVSWEYVPTVEGVTGITNYGPGATLFTLSRDHGVQQYDINPMGQPSLVASAKHVPSNTPPTPPLILDDRANLYSRSRGGRGDTPSLPAVSDTGESSTDDGLPRSPRLRLGRLESLDPLDDELRDVVMPLSPNSSRTSSVSSKSSGGRRRDRRYLYDRPDSSRAPSTTGPSTEFSLGTPSLKQGHDSMSIKSVSSLHSNSRYRSSQLRNQVLRSSEESRHTTNVDLFPHARARLKDVPFRTPHYGNVARTPELLQREMLSVLFGWNDTARSLIRDEMSRHKSGSVVPIFLAKWLGEVPSSTMPTSSSDIGATTEWMMLALNGLSGMTTQKTVGETFAQRLLERGEVHPAVAILLGLGEFNDAIEIYVAQKCWLEAVLLTCITCPTDWQRISHLIRKWGETAVQGGQAELAVRCFSCNSIETSEPWFSPRAQDAAYTAQQERLTRPPSAGPPLTSPPLSPPSRSGSQRLAQKNASLKLITSFGDKGVPLSMDVPTPMNAMGVTPIAQSALPFSALSPGGQDVWQQTRVRGFRDPSSARTATPGGFGKTRLPSRSDIERAKQEAANINTPITAARDAPPQLPTANSRRTSSLGSLSLGDLATARKTSQYSDRLAPDTASQNSGHLPSPSAGAFTRFQGDPHTRRTTSQERKPDGLAVQIVETRYISTSSGHHAGSTHSSRANPISPASTSKSAKARSIDEYLAGVDEAREQARERRTHSKHRDGSRKRDGSRSSANRRREPSEPRGRHHQVQYIRPAKRSPSSPVPMSPEEILLATQAAKSRLAVPEPATSEDENFYKVASPIDGPQKADGNQEKLEARVMADAEYEASRGKSAGPARSRADSARGRATDRRANSQGRSPSLPLLRPAESQTGHEQDETNSDGRRVRLRAGSQTVGGEGWEPPARSSSRKPAHIDDPMGVNASTVSHNSSLPDKSLAGSTLSTATDNSTSRPRGLTKALAQKELEERRLSLARRPSAPAIPLPGEASTLLVRPSMSPRSNTDIGNALTRSQTVDPDQMSRYGRNAAPIGLPSTPRAMRHPRYMAGDPNEREGTPPVPDVPDSASNLSSLGSSLSHVSNSLYAPSNLTSNVTSNLTSHLTSNASYLASHLSYDTSSMLSSNLSSNPHIYDEDNIAPLLPSTVYNQKAPLRAASAPPEKSSVHPAYNPKLPPSTRKTSYVRKILPPDTQGANAAAVTSIDETLAGAGDQQVVFITNDSDAPPILPELQHLADPPPPPPPPPPKQRLPPLNTQYNSSGVINIAIDDNQPSSAVEPGPPPPPPLTLPSTTYPHPMDRAMTTSPSGPLERATTASPNTHRRGRGSVTGSVTDAFGSRFRDFSERMRSTSRNRTNKSPAEYRAPTLPYESVVPPMPSSSSAAYQQHQRRESERAKSPYEQAMAMQQQQQQRLPAVDGTMVLKEHSIPPSTLPRSSSAQGYGQVKGGGAKEKELRANMPPETLQQGVYTGEEAGFL
ncbi:hypothetical protein BDY17DRAFT_345621 [Neohortaea acidophila]|uniref:Gem-associated protein 5 TPR domain-containing protein n=1 Tax=Neohortaea acidophila TaxID=245834 RepID=A0A6A6PTF9_9PEZI|nr:uncharacterized protein BDY17DRAFT_345621 [Neohortaea acidophila]KAF2482971.1 hypothetical protein BDY17DRAFT_345621 [Neohortaea acidophila]